MSGGKYSSIDPRQVFRKYDIRPDYYLNPDPIPISNTNIDQQTLNTIAYMIKMKAKLTGGPLGNETSRCEYISEIVTGVAYPIEKRVFLEREYPQCGGRLDYAFTYKDFAVCIIEAKKDDMDKGVLSLWNN